MRISKVITSRSHPASRRSIAFCQRRRRSSWSGDEKVLASGSRRPSTNHSVVRFFFSHISFCHRKFQNRQMIASRVKSNRSNLHVCWKTDPKAWTSVIDFVSPDVTPRTSMRKFPWPFWRSLWFINSMMTSSEFISKFSFSFTSLRFRNSCSQSQPNRRIIQLDSHLLYIVHLQNVFYLSLSD